MAFELTPQYIIFFNVVFKYMCVRLCSYCHCSNLGDDMSGNDLKLPTTI